MLSEDEKKEMLRLSGSSSLRQDMEYIATCRHNPVVSNGRVDMDRLLEFLTQFNEFINHQPKPFKPMVERTMKL